MQDDFGNDLQPHTAHQIHSRLIASDARMLRIEQGLQANTAATEAIRDSTAELVEVFRAMQGAFRVLNWLGRLARPLSYIAALVAAGAGLWASIKGGGKL